MSQPTLLPYGRQSIDDSDVAAVAAALRSDYLTTGPEVSKLEGELAAITGARHVVVCNSGTAALHLAMLAVGIGPGDAVIVPTLTFLATANVVRMCGADVIFADVDPDTGLVTEKSMLEALGRVPSGRRVKAAFAVHLNGQFCDLPSLAGLLADRKIDLIEDAAHALGASYRWDAASPSRIACFSTHPVKTIATGEGGFTVTNDAALAEAMANFRSHGMVRDPSRFMLGDVAFDDGQPNPWHYEMHQVGWNYRLPDVLCALGRSQLMRLHDFMARRRTLAAQYDRALASLAPIVRPVPRGEGPDGWHLYPVLVDFTALGKSRRVVMEQLRAAGIGTQVHYLPVHLQPYYREASPTPRLPGAEAYFSRCLSIPFYPALTDQDQKRVVAALSSLVH
ncbi:UDP-4-amino-4,6-dideoxy-N-acetyl-beta-L-altrosamine transaminase [Alsobacter sp. R-9]